MTIKQLRSETRLSQGKFAELFGIPVATLQDWESERRKAPSYVVNLIRENLEFKKLFNSKEYSEKCLKREMIVEQMLGIVYSATDGPNDNFNDALQKFIDGSLSLKELENNTNKLKYI